MVKWEYKIIDVDILSKRDLNYWGQQGWELCAIGGTYAYGTRGFMKRPLQDESSDDYNGTHAYPDEN